MCFFFQCLKNESTYLLLVVGNDTPDKVGVGVVECHHESAELFFVRLTNCVEHSLPGPGTKR